MKKVYVGIDIGGTNSAMGLVDANGGIIDRDLLSTLDFKEAIFEDYLSALISKVEEMLRRNNRMSDLAGVGIGAPNGNFFNGCIEFAPNLPWKGKHNFTEGFNTHFDVPTILTNDANAAAIGEMHFGSAKGLKDFIMITLGTGVGGGVVCNGELVYGHDGFAGEIGHSIVYRDGRLCTCGRKGCLEAYVSIRGIKQTTIRLMGKESIESELRKVPEDQLDPKTIFEWAEKGDQLAIEAYRRTGEILGFKLADAAALVSPKAFVIFGGIAQAGDILFKPLRESLENSLLEVYRGKIQLFPSTIEQNNAAILGAAALVI